MKIALKTITVAALIYFCNLFIYNECIIYIIKFILLGGDFFFLLYLTYGPKAKSVYIFCSIRTMKKSFVILFV